MRQELDIEHFLKLTLAIYRVTELFPKEGEDLKYQIRKSANKVLADFLYNQDENGSRTIKGLLGLFKEAEAKNWVDSRNFLVLYREYDKLIKSVKTVENHSCLMSTIKQDSDRRDKILEAVNKNGKVKVRDLAQLFPQLNRRTLIRDLEKLCRSGQVVRVGSNGRGVYYTKNEKIM